MNWEKNVGFGGIRVQKMGEQRDKHKVPSKRE